MDEPGWGHYCDEDNLRFRAACYDVVPPAVRPIRRHVVRRLARSDDTKAIWESLPPGDDRSSLPDDKRFAALVADPRWQALVAERVDEARRWSDFWSGFLEKGHGDQRPGPASADKRPDLREVWEWIADHGGLVLIKMSPGVVQQDLPAGAGG